MKTFIRIIFTLLLIGIFTPGCEKGLLDVKFKSDFVADLNADVAGKLQGKSVAQTFSFTTSDIVDPLTDPDVNKYKDKIKDVSLTKISAEITSISKTVQLVTGKLKVTSTGFTSAEWNFTNQTIQVGSVLSIGNESGQITNVQTMLNSLNPVTVTLSGDTDQGNVQFTLEVTFYTDITANPL